MSSDHLTANELTALVQRVFKPGADDHALAIIVDLPDQMVADNPRWARRRELAAGWARELAGAADEHGLEIALFWYRNAHSNNADLPEVAWRGSVNEVPDHCSAMTGRFEEPFEDILRRHRMVLAPTEFSATAPLKMLCPKFGCRAATMPGFSTAMVPALRLDYAEVNRRVHLLKNLLDRAIGAELLFAVDADHEYRLTLDLRHRRAHASGGLLHEPGTAGNLPSGEAYIVPYEGENAGDPSGTCGSLPVQLGDEVVVFEIAANCAVEVISDGPESVAEARRLSDEPARGNLAELGLGVLADFGIAPIGEVLLDEKLGLHLAFGRSEHFGGQVGPAQFSTPAAVVHQDHVYLSAIQPRVTAREVSLEFSSHDSLMLIQDGEYTIDFAGVSPP